MIPVRPLSYHHRVLAQPIAPRPNISFRLALWRASKFANTVIVHYGGDDSPTSHLDPVLPHTMPIDDPSSQLDPLPPRSRKRSSRTHDYDLDMEQKKARQQHYQTRRQLASEAARESQIVTDDDNFAFPPASECVKPVLQGDTAEDLQKYESDFAQFLLRKADAYGGHSRKLRVAWSDKDHPMTLAQLEDAVNNLTAGIPLEPASNDKGKGKAPADDESDSNPYPSVAFGQSAVVNSQGPSRARAGVDPRFSGVPAPSAPAALAPAASAPAALAPAPKRPAPDTSSRSAPKKARPHAYAKSPFPDNQHVPQAANGSQRQSAIARAHSQGHELSQSDSRTLLDGRCLFHPQNRDPNAVVVVPATAETIPDSPPRQLRHVTDSAASQPHPKNPRRPTTGLKIAPVLPPHPGPGGNDVASQKSGSRPEPPSRAVKPAANPRSTLRDEMPAASLQPARSSAPGQGSVVANARSDSRAGRTSVNQARVSANASGHQLPPVEQRVAPAIGGQVRQGTANARGGVNAPAAPPVNGQRRVNQPAQPAAPPANGQHRVSQPARPAAPPANGQRRVEEPAQPVAPPANQRRRAEEPVPPARPVAPAHPRPPTPDGVDKGMDLDEEEGDVPAATDLRGSPTDPRHVILHHGKVTLQSFCRLIQNTVRTFRLRFKTESIAGGTYEWVNGDAGPRVLSNEEIAALAWEYATRRHGNQFPFLIELLTYGQNVIMAYRSNVKRELEFLVANHWKFSEGSPELNRALAEDLLPDGFHEEDEPQGTVPFGSGFMMLACHQAVFNGPGSIGVRHPDYFNPVPWRFLAFVATICYQIIYSWSTGTYLKESLDEAQQLPVFGNYMKLIEKTHRRMRLRLEKICITIHDEGRSKYVTAPARARSPQSPERWAPDIEERHVSRFQVEGPNRDDDGELGQDQAHGQFEDEDEDQPGPAPLRQPAARRPVAHPRHHRISLSPEGSPAPLRAGQPPGSLRQQAAGPREALARRPDLGYNVAGPSRSQRGEPRAENFGIAGPSRRTPPGHDNSDDLPSPARIRISAQLNTVVREEDQMEIEGAPGNARDDDNPYEDEEMGNGTGIDFEETLKESPEDAEAAEYEDEQERDGEAMLD